MCLKQPPQCLSVSEDTFVMLNFNEFNLFHFDIFLELGARNQIAPEARKRDQEKYKK